MHEVLVNRLGGLSLPRKSVVRLTDRPDMTLDVYRGRKTTMKQQQQYYNEQCYNESLLQVCIYFLHFLVESLPENLDENFKVCYKYLSIEAE